MSRKSNRKISRKGGTKTSNKQVIQEYMEKLSNQLDEKKIRSFCVFPEDGFKKKMREGIKAIKTKIKVEKGHKYLACILIGTLCKEESKKTIPGEAGIWLTASINVIPISENGELLSKKAFGINMHWKEEDFKIARFSMKMLEYLMQQTIDKKLSVAGVFGVPFHELIERLKYKKIDLSAYLKPLTNLS